MRSHSPVPLLSEATFVTAWDARFARETRRWELFHGGDVLGSEHDVKGGAQASPRLLLLPDLAAVTW